MSDPAPSAPSIASARIVIVEETGEFALTAAGTAPAGSTVLILLDGVVLGQATSDAEGRYAATVPVASMGSHQLVAALADASGAPGATSPARPFTLGTANDPGAKDWGYFVLASNGETYTTHNGRKDWSVSAPDDRTLRFEVHDRDVAYYDYITRAPSERSEVRLVEEFKNGEPVEISYTFNVESGARNDAAWLVLGQLHQSLLENAKPWSPPFSIGLSGERMVIYAGHTAPDGSLVNVKIFEDTADIVRGRDYDINIRAVFDPNGAGRLVVVRDGVTIADYAGPLNYVGHDGVYWQYGIYRHAGATLPLAVNYSDMVVRSGEAATPPDADLVPFASVRVASAVGLDVLALEAFLDTAGASAARAAAPAFHWQSSADGTSWTDLADGAALRPSGDLAGLLLRAVATSADGTHTAVSAETIRFGGTGDDALAGTERADILVGFEGRDTIEGRAGDDVIYGGAGDDTLLGGGGNDTIGGDGGNDTLFGGAGDDLLDGGVGDDVLYGGLGRDKLVGGAGDDRLDGGEDDDALYGFAGDDTLLGGGGNDFINGGGGRDTLHGGAGDDVLAGLADDDALYGEAGNDTLNGGDGRDVLDGGAGKDRLDGGAGADHMAGGTGDDTYVVDDAFDVIEEIDNALGGGRDGVFASVSYALSDFVENLTLTGAGDIDGTGNALANRIAGNAGANVLSGRGGSDVLSGGAGADTFVFEAAEAGNRDRVLDFSSAEGDKVAVLGAAFGLAPGSSLDVARLVVGAGLAQGTLAGVGQFLFDTASHTLSFDADGAGAGAAVALATFDRAVLSAGDILVV